MSFPERLKARSARHAGRLTWLAASFRDCRSGHLVTPRLHRKCSSVLTFVRPSIPQQRHPPESRPVWVHVEVLARRLQQRREKLGGSMDRHLAPHLQRLDELSDYAVEAGDLDPRGWPVISTDGRTLGTVEDLIVDTTTMK